MKVADEAEHRFGRKVSWGVICADQRATFTTLSVPAMTRLRLAERQVLDTLVDAGVARSRSHALAWCVRLVAERQDDWLARPARGPDVGREGAGRGPEGLTAARASAQLAWAIARSRRSCWRRCG